MRQINMKCIKLKLYLAPQRTVQFYWVRRMFQSDWWGLRTGLECHDGEDGAGQLNLYQYFTLIRGTRPRYQLRLCLLCGRVSLLPPTVMGRGLYLNSGGGREPGYNSWTHIMTHWLGLSDRGQHGATVFLHRTPANPIESVEYGWEVIVWINLLNCSPGSLYLYQQRQYEPLLRDFCHACPLSQVSGV